MVLYFSKLNLVSGHIFEVQKNLELLENILNEMVSELKDDLMYIKTRTVCNIHNELEVETVSYKLHIIDISKDVVRGVIYKDSTIYYNTLDNVTHILERHEVPNTEAIRFYFDVKMEIVGFHSTQRFGYKEFNEAFCGIINNAMESSGKAYRFNIALKTNGIGAKDLERDLRNIDNLVELEFRFQQPNPDEEVLARLEQKGEQAVKEMKQAGITEMSFLYLSKTDEGLDLDSEVIQENIRKIKGVDEYLGEGTATSRGYISVNAKDKKGGTYTTKENKPITQEISDKANFFEACKKKISTFVGRLI